MHIFERECDLTNIADTTKEEAMWNLRTFDDLFQFFLDYFELVCFNEWVENDFPNYNTTYLNELLSCAGCSDEEEIRIAKKIQKRI